MHDQVLVRVLHGVADLAEETQALLDRELLLLAPVGDRHALDVLQDEVRHALLGRAAVEQPRDVGVLEVREDLPLVPEARDRGAALQLELERLDRDLLVELVVVADGQVDRAHAAASERAHDPIGPEAAAGPVVVVARRPPRPRLFDDTGQAAAAVAKRGQQFTAQVLVARAAARR